MPALLEADAWLSAAAVQKPWAARGSKKQGTARFLHGYFFVS
jgi:hypothetical protein